MITRVLDQNVTIAVRFNIARFGGLFADVCMQFFRHRAWLSREQNAALSRTENAMGKP